MTENLSDDPLYPVSLHGVSVSVGNSNPYTRFPIGLKHTKLEVTSCPYYSLAENPLKISLFLEAYSRGKPAILAVTHGKTIANSKAYCKNTC